MYRYEFVDVELERGFMFKGSFMSSPTYAFEECKEIINQKAKEGFELVQVIPVPNEKTGVYGLVKYTIIFKVCE